MLEKYLAVSDDPLSAQYGLPKWVKVDGEWTEVEKYVARCKAVIQNDTGRTRPDGSKIWDVSRNAADWNAEEKRIEWPGGKVGGTAVFLGLPHFSRGLSHDKKTGEPIVDNTTLSLEFDRAAGSRLDPAKPRPDDVMKLRMIYRDLHGKLATNCVVYLVDED